jgi:hypothetical protein
MIKYGFEGEFFVASLADGVLQPISADIPHDSCGYLAEARGVPDSDPLVASYLYKAAVAKLEAVVAKKNLKLIQEAIAPVPADTLRAARRLFGKGPTKYNNIYGLDYKPSDRTRRAGLHIHISDETVFRYEKNKEFKYTNQLDFPPIIQAFDKAFKEEIKSTKRLPGFYEMKPYGFEYRSLPATASLEKIVEVLSKLGL